MTEELKLMLEKESRKRISINKFINLKKKEKRIKLLGKKMKKNVDSVALQTIKNLRCSYKNRHSEFEKNLKYVLNKYNIEPYGLNSFHNEKNKIKMKNNNLDLVENQEIFNQTVRHKYSF